MGVEVAEAVSVVVVEAVSVVVVEAVAVVVVEVVAVAKVAAVGEVAGIAVKLATVEVIVDIMPTPLPLLGLIQIGIVVQVLLDRKTSINH